MARSRPADRSRRSPSKIANAGPGPGDCPGLRAMSVASRMGRSPATWRRRRSLRDRCSGSTSSAPGSRSVRISVFRIGWYGGAGGREVLRSASLRVLRQPPCSHSFRTGLTNCRWHPTLSFPIPSALPSGVYIAKLSTSRGQRDCLFVVRSTRPQPLLAQLPTSTYEAYNAWGGDSLYPGGAFRVGVTRSTQGVEVSYQRPYDSATGAGQFFARDVAMVWFLERYRYPISYTASESVDADPGQLARHRAVIDFGHSEYWSQRQASAFARARNGGASLLFLSSDTMAWRAPLRSPPADHDRRVQGVRGARPQPGDADRSLPRWRRFVDGLRVRGVHHAAAERHRSPPLRLLRVDGHPRPASRVAVRAHRDRCEDDDSRDRRLRARHAHARDTARRTDRGRRVRVLHEHRAGRARSGVRSEPGPVDALHDASRRDRVQLRDTRLGARPRTGAERLAQRASCARPAGRRDDAQPARAGAATARRPGSCLSARAGGK